MTTVTEPGGAAWAAWLAGSGAAGVPRADALCELIWATDRLNQQHVVGTRPGGRPIGFPDKTTVRAAGRELLHLVRDRADPDGADPARRMLALVGIHMYAQPTGRPSPDDEVQVRARALQAGLEELRATAGDDAPLMAWASWKTALAARIARQHEPALLRAREAADGFAAAAGRPSALWTALRSAPWLEEPGTLCAVGRVRALRAVELNSIALGDYAGYRRAVDERAQAGEALVEVRPDMACVAVAAPAARARGEGDRPVFRAVEERLRRWAAESGDWNVTRQWLFNACANASLVGDGARAQELRLRRLAVIGEHLGQPAPATVTAAYGLEVARQCQASGIVTVAEAVGNVAYDISASMYERLRLDVDAAARAEAATWVGVAETAWASFGVNGLNSARMMRARLASTEPGWESRRDRIVTDLLQVAADANIDASRVGALLSAAELCSPRDVRVRDALLSFLGRLRRRVRGRALAALAFWGAAAAESDEEWRQAAEWALEATTVLGDPAAPIAADLAGRCWLVVAGAAGHAGDTAAELRHLLAAISLLAVQLVNATSPVDRTRLSTTFAPALRRTIELAIAEDDHVSADLLLEATRRDRVGSLLAQLATTPGVSTLIRETAETVLAANAAVPLDRGGAAEPDDPAGRPTGPASSD